MPQSLTRNLVFFISGCFILTLLQPNLKYEFALYGLEINNGQWYRLLTVALVHGGWLHLLFNMLALYSLGITIENYFGKSKYIFILLTSLIFGSLTSYFFNPLTSFAVGSSGMIFGLFGALALIGQQAGIEWRSILVIVGINFAIGFVLGGVDWRGHLGGLIGGTLITTVLNRSK